MSIALHLVGASLIASLGPPAPRVPPSKPTRTASEAPNALVRRADGGYEYRDADAGFSATIHADGTVTFHKVARIKIGVPSILGLGKRVRSAFDQFNDKSNTLERRGTTTDSKRDPTVEHGPYGAPPILVSFGGRFGGISDLLVGSRTSKAKREFLTRTTDLRESLAADARARNEQAALLALMDALAEIWAEGTTPEQRRRRIFELWDECEPAGGDSQDASTPASRRARQVIDAFVRRVAPASSKVGYTLRELDALNAVRTSRETFDPYLIPSDEPAPVDAGP